MTVEVGLCLSAFGDRPLADALRTIRDLGLDLVDLPTDSPFVLSEDPPDRVPALLDEYGVRVACVSNSRDCQLLLGPHGPHTDGVFGGDRAAKSAHALRCARETIELAALVGAPLVRLFLGCPDFGRWLRWPGSDVSWDDNVEEFVECAAPLAAAAAEAGVILCVEPHVKQVPYDARSVAACVDGVRKRGGTLAVCFDPANVAALHYDPVEFLAAMGEVPVCVHAKDIEVASSAVPPVGRGWVSYGPHPAIRFRSVPWGMLDWRQIFTGLSEIGFAGPVLIEHEDVLVDRCQAIAGAKRYLESILVEPAVGPPWW